MLPWYIVGLLITCSLTRFVWVFGLLFRGLVWIVLCRRADFVWVDLRVCFGLFWGFCFGLCLCYVLWCDLGLWG